MPEIGTITVESINEDSEDANYITGYRAVYTFPDGDEFRAAYGTTEAQAIHHLADRVDVENEKSSYEESQPVRVTNSLLPVGLFEDYRDEDTTPKRDED